MTTSETLSERCFPKEHVQTLFSKPRVTLTHPVQYVLVYILPSTEQSLIMVSLAAGPRPVLLGMDSIPSNESGWMNHIQRIRALPECANAILILHGDGMEMEMSQHLMNKLETLTTNKEAMLYTRWMLNSQHLMIHEPFITNIRPFHQILEQFETTMIRFEYIPLRTTRCSPSDELVIAFQKALWSLKDYMPSARL